MREETDFLRNLYISELPDMSTYQELFLSWTALLGSTSGALSAGFWISDPDGRLLLAGCVSKGMYGGLDKSSFVRALSIPVLCKLLHEHPKECFVIECGDDVGAFPSKIRRYLPGMSILVAPLYSDNSLVGFGMFYRKGEQPFVESDIKLIDETRFGTAEILEKIGKSEFLSD